MLKILNMLLVIAVLGAVAFSARQTDRVIREELQIGSLKKKPVKPKSEFEYDLKPKMEVRDKVQKRPVSKKPVKPKPDFKYQIKSKINFSKIQMRDISKVRGDSGCGEILVFDDMETVKHTLKDLEEQVEKYDKAFLAYYSHLDEEELNKKEEEIYYNENQPLIEFEKSLCFSSSNTDYQKAEARYLNQKNMNDKDDPDNDFIGETEERTLINACNELMIDGTIYKLTKDGYFEIDDGDFKKLGKLDDIKNLPDNVRFINGDNSKEIQNLPEKSWSFQRGNSNFMTSRGLERCRSWRYLSGRVTHGSRRIRWMVYHWTYPWGRYAGARTQNYRRRSGRWRPYRTLCAAMVYGHVSADNFCVSRYNFNPKYRYRVRTSRGVSHKIRVQGPTKSGWVQGEHYGANGISHYSTLTF